MSVTVKPAALTVLNLTASAKIVRALPVLDI
jgi:hypothetical protein